MNYLDKLKELTDDLPPIPKLEELAKYIGKDFIEYNVDKGKSRGFALLSRPEVAVMELVIEEGTEWPVHNHPNEKEWGIIFEGKMEICCGNNNTKIILGPGDAVEIAKGQTHSGTALEKTKLIAISVPRNDGYPE